MTIEVTHLKEQWLRAEDPLLRPPLLRSGQETPFALSSGPVCARRDRDKATSSAPAPAPAPAPGAPSAPEQSSDANLMELAELVDMPNDAAAAALTNHLLDLRRVASRPILPNARAANAAAVPPGRPAPPAPAPDGSSTCSSTVAEKFALHVMCNYTPRAPGELPMKDWVSSAQLLRQLHPHTLSEDQVKRLITNHFKDHPTFAGHDFSAWNKRLKDFDAPAGGGRKSVMKFSLEYTPTGASHLKP